MLLSCTFRGLDSHTEESSGAGSCLTRLLGCGVERLGEEGKVAARIGGTCEAAGGRKSGGIQGAGMRNGSEEYGQCMCWAGGGG